MTKTNIMCRSRPLASRRTLTPIAITVCPPSHTCTFDILKHCTASVLNGRPLDCTWHKKPFKTPGRLYFPCLKPPSPWLFGTSLNGASSYAKLEREKDSAANLAPAAGFIPALNSREAHRLSNTHLFVVRRHSKTAIPERLSRVCL